MSQEIWPLASEMFLRGHFPNTDHSQVLHAASRVFDGMSEFSQKILLLLAGNNMNISALALKWYREGFSFTPTSAQNFIRARLTELQEGIRAELHLSTVSSSDFDDTTQVPLVISA